MKDRMIELILNSKILCNTCGESSNTYCAEALADHLLANGLPGQEWISVKDRLPETIPCGAGTVYSEAVIVWTDGRKAMMAVFDSVDFICPMDFWDAWGEKITHWMPLPKPPKGGDGE